MSLLKQIEILTKSIEAWYYFLKDNEEWNIYHRDVFVPLQNKSKEPPDPTPGGLLMLLRELHEHGGIVAHAKSSDSPPVAPAPRCIVVPGMMMPDFKKIAPDRDAALTRDRSRSASPVSKQRRAPRCIVVPGMMMPDFKKIAPDRDATLTRDRSRSASPVGAR
jgi:hypothetical protein